MSKKRKKQKGSTIYLCAMVFLVFVIMYLVTPHIYGKIKETKYKSQQEQLIASLNTSDDIEMLITRYAIENNAFVKVESKNQTKSYQTPVISSVSYQETNTDFTLSDGTSMTLIVQYANNDIVTLNHVFLIVFPVFAAFLMILIYLYHTLGKSVAKDDFQQFEKLTNEMLLLKPNVKLPTNDHNKSKNALASNVNELYDQLFSAVQTFKDKMQQNSLLEKQTLATLKQASEKVNEPIEEVKTILNGLILNENKYYNQRSYLIEAKMKLEELQSSLEKDFLSTKASDIPVANNVHDYFKRLFQPYELLCLEKRVRVRYKFSQPFDISVQDFMFTKAFRLMMDFILKQCQPQSNIVVVQNEFDIIIAYKGVALSDASIHHIRENDANLKALFAMIESMKLYLDFETTQKKDGMQFVFHF